MRTGSHSARMEQIFARHAPIPATGVMGAYFPLNIFRICFRKCRRNVRFKRRELLFIRRMLKAGISRKKSAITRLSAGFSGAYFPIRICRVFFVGNDGLSDAGLRRHPDLSISSTPSLAHRRCAPAIARTDCYAPAFDTSGNALGFRIDSMAKSTSRSGQYRWCSLGRST
jgi:hypothetical protein